MVRWVDKSVIPLQGAFASNPSYGQKRIRSSFEHDSFGFHDGARVQCYRQTKDRNAAAPFVKTTHNDWMSIQ
jgi:hypothetical protein